MEKYSIPSIYYEDVRINICHPLDDLPKQIVKEILNELNEDDHVYSWFNDWGERDLWYCVVATVNEKPISIAGASKDGKVLRYLYTLKPYRIKYRGIAQMDFMRVFVNKAITPTLYISIHAFTKKHEKLARSYDRQMLSGVPRELQPYAGKWKYEGVRTYRNVDQHHYRLYLKEFI
jgi:hypothetical protein|tara:strand:- start:1706 stop:2233 length:528 start_codon:yes stop_codon:yes gene_type:complete